MNKLCVVMCVVLTLASSTASAFKVPHVLQQLTPAEVKAAGVTVKALETIPAGVFIEIALSPSSTCSGEQAFFSMPGIEVPVTFQGSRIEVFVETRMLAQARIILQCKRQSPAAAYPCGVGFAELADPRLVAPQPWSCYRLDEVKKLLIVNKPQEALSALMPCLDWAQSHVTINLHGGGQSDPDPLGNGSVLQAAYFQKFSRQLRILANDLDWFRKGIPGSSRDTDIWTLYPSWFQSGLINMEMSSLSNLERCLYAEKSGSSQDAMSCYRQGSVFREYSRMSVLALAQNETTEAANYARHALAIDQYDASAMSTLAALRERNGDKEGALCMYRAALHSLRYHQRMMGALPVEYWEAGAIQQGIDRLKSARDACVDERKLYRFMESAPEWALGFESPYGG